MHHHEKYLYWIFCGDFFVKKASSTPAHSFSIQIPMRGGTQSEKNSDFKNVYSVMIYTLKNNIIWREEPRKIYMQECLYNTPKLPTIFETEPTIQKSIFVRKHNAL